MGACPLFPGGWRRGGRRRSNLSDQRATGVEGNALPVGARGREGGLDSAARSARCATGAQRWENRR